MTALAAWFRPPRHVLALFLGVTGSLFLAMGWLAWQVAAQDAALAAQRTEERLDNAADASAATLRNALGDLAQRLEALSKFPAATAAGEFAQQASRWPGFAGVCPRRVPRVRAPRPGRRAPRLRAADRGR